MSKKVLPSTLKELIKILPPELKDLLFKQWHAKQNPQWHPEGNTLKHILIVLKRAYKEHSDNPNVILSALFHDLGKLATYKISDKTGQPTAYGHEDISANMVQKYHRWIEDFEGADSNIIYHVVKNHMKIKYMDKMRDFKKKEFITHPSYPQLQNFTKLDRGGNDV
jgi:putative nucleotidyltransferase with HDIG domain